MKRFALIAVFALFAYVSMMLSGCGLSDSEKNRIAKVTCAEIKETRNMDSAPRVRLMNEAREKLKLEPFLEGDEEIVRSVKWGTCELLVHASPDYTKRTNTIEYKVKSAKQERANEEYSATMESIARGRAEEAERDRLAAEAVREIIKEKKKDKTP